jgi:signal transduction histidine kinase
MQQKTKSAFNAPIRESVLAQVLDNLLDNAVYWLGQKSARDDRILVVHLDSEARTILVTNSGPPIQNHIRSRLFQKFAGSKLNGRGLGLFICRELLTRHGAAIEVVEREIDSRCLCGASFLIELPAKAVSGKAA